MLSSQEEMAERRATLRNDLKVQQEERQRMFAPNEPNKTSTYFRHAIADADTPRGRFSAVDASYVVGSKPDASAAYPAASSAHQTELPPEEPLGYSVEEMIPVGPEYSLAQGQGGAPSAFDVAAPPPNPELGPASHHALPVAQALPDPAPAPTGDVERAGSGLFRNQSGDQTTEVSTRVSHTSGPVGSPVHYRRF
jgi:hypothetical protein